jgi:hypothetical protein
MSRRREVPMLLSAALKSAAPTDPTAPVLTLFGGSWVNELGSTMTIDQDGSLLSGTYTSPASGSGDPAHGALRGYASGRLIAFSVLWDDFQSITSWTGHMNGTSIDEIATLWQMVVAVPPGDGWESIYAGADTFRRS